MSEQCGHQANIQAPLPATASRQAPPLRQGGLARKSGDADQNRAWFRHLLALNILSSPGAGKTALIQRLLRDRDLIAEANPLYTYNVPVQAGVIVGDLASDRDAERLRQTGVPVVQITIDHLCHLEANMVAKAAQELDFANLNLLIVENVGNLAYPAGFDLGEDLRFVLMSVTEGEDKPLKYPALFKSAHAVIISKIDLAGVIDFNRDEALHYLRLIAPQALIFELSATTGEGLAKFYAYLNQNIFQCSGRAS